MSFYLVMKTKVSQKLGFGDFLTVLFFFFFKFPDLFLLVENNSLKIILIYMTEKHVRLRQLIHFPGMLLFSLNPQTFERLWPGGLHVLNVTPWSTFFFSMYGFSRLAPIKAHLWKWVNNTLFFISDYFCGIYGCRRDMKHLNVSFWSSNNYVLSTLKHHINV